MNQSRCEGVYNQAGDVNVPFCGDEELWDIMYYVLAIANCYGIDLEKVIPIKEKLNNERYQTGMTFDPQ